MQRLLLVGFLVVIAGCGSKAGADKPGDKPEAKEAKAEVKSRGVIRTERIKSNTYPTVGQMEDRPISCGIVKLLYQENRVQFEEKYLHYHIEIAYSGPMDTIGKDSKGYYLESFQWDQYRETVRLRDGEAQKLSKIWEDAKTKNKAYKVWVKTFVEEQGNNLVFLDGVVVEK